MVGAWLGIVAGWLEVAVLGAIKWGGLALPPEGWVATSLKLRHSFIWLSPHIVWIAPAVLTVLFAGVSSILAIVGRRWPRVGSPRTIVASIVFLGAVNLLWVYPRLYAWAVLILAGGIAVQSARVTARHFARMRLIMAATLWWMVGAATMSAVGLTAWRAFIERQAYARLSPALDGAPNVLLLILDTVRATDLTAYGYERPTTPTLAALAERGVLFERAYATSPWTLPSHVSAFTGRLPYEVSASWLSPYEGEFPTLAERLGEQGYVTGGFVANVMYAGYESGLSRGFVHYEDYPLRFGEFLVSVPLTRRVANNRLVRRIVGYHDIINRKSAEDVTSEFLDWHQRIRTDRPYFAFLNYLDAHEPYLPPTPFDTVFGPVEVRKIEDYEHHHRQTLRPYRETMDASQTQGEIDAYDGAIAYVDQQIGRLLRQLEERGSLANTLIIVSSDHGEQFGEHGLYRHGNSLYLPSLQVPMIVASEDRIPEGMRVADAVSIRDIPATVASVTGLASRLAFPGSSLERFWVAGPAATTPSMTSADSSSLSDGIFSELTDLRGAPVTKSLIIGPYHYIWSEEQREEVYDLESDPGEERNVAIAASRSGLIARLRRALAPHVVNDRALWERLPETGG